MFELDDPNYDFHRFKGQTIGHDQNRIKALVFGKIPPLDAEDDQLLAWIGGARLCQAPVQWIKCHLCSTEFKASGFPWQDSSWVFPTICQACADLWDAGLHPAHPSRSCLSKRLGANLRRPKLSEDD
jgi:hypothetical protein